MNRTFSSIRRLAVDRCLARGIREDAIGEVMEEFGKLIVAECMLICEQHGASAKYSYTPARALIAEGTAYGCATLIGRTFE